MLFENIYAKVFARCVFWVCVVVIVASLIRLYTKLNHVKFNAPVSTIWLKNSTYIMKSERFRFMTTSDVI